MSEHVAENDTGWTTAPNPDQPERCPSIDPHDVLQCARSIHEDDRCQCGGIAWKKGTPRHITPEERLARVVGVLTEWGALASDGDFVDDEDFAEAIGESGAWRLARDLRAALGREATGGPDA